MYGAIVPFANAGSAHAGSIEDANPLDLASALVALVEGGFQERWEIAKLFPMWGDAAIAPLIELLHTDDPDLSWFVARILGTFNHPEAATALVTLLQSTDPDLSSMAADALGTMGEAAIAILSPQLENSATRLLAVHSLALIHHAATADILLRVVNDGEAEVRATAIAALSNIPDPRCVAVLVNALEDRSAAVRREAVLGLGLVASRLRQGDPTIAYSLDDLATLLHPYLWDFNLEVCHQAVLALGRVGNDRASASVYQAMMASTTPPDLQRACILALGWMSTPSALDCLQRALLHFLEASPDQAQAAISSLGQIEATELITPASQRLIALLNQDAPSLEDPAIRQLLALNLGQLGARRSSPAIEQALHHLVADRDAGVRLHAIAALKRVEGGG